MDDSVYRLFRVVKCLVGDIVPIPKTGGCSDKRSSKRPSL